MLLTALKLLAAAFVKLKSFRANPVTPSLNVAVTVNAALIGLGEFEDKTTIGAVLSVFNCPTSVKLIFGLLSAAFAHKKSVLSPVTVKSTPFVNELG